MLCAFGNNTKERVLDQFQINQIIGPTPRTDGSWFVLKPNEFDAENKRLSDEILSTHNIANSFWTREGNVARFSDTFAHLVDVVDARGDVISVPPQVNTPTEAEVVRNPILRRLNRAFLGIKAVIFDNSKQLLDKALELSEAPTSDIRFAIIGEKGASRVRSAQTVLGNLSTAKEMDEKRTPEEIKAATGWEKGVDGLWRYEHPYLSFSPDFVSKNQDKGRIDKYTYVGEILQGDAILETYPELENIDVILNINPYNVPSGSFRRGEDRSGQDLFDLSPEIRIDARSLEEAESIMVHEIQHAIQSLEGFAAGGSQSNLQDSEELSSLLRREKELEDIIEASASKVRSGGILTQKEISEKETAEKDMVRLEEELKTFPQKAFERYRKLAGEVEARNAQTRARMSPEERQASLMASTEDVAKEDQKVLFGALGLVGYEDAPIIRYGNKGADPIGKIGDRDELARQRFDIPKFNKIGKGSDRTVLDLGDGNVVKIAHTARGLEQNRYEGDWGLKGIVPEVLERGINYVVVRNIPRLKSADIVTTYDPVTGEEVGTSTAGQMIKDLSRFSAKDFDRKTSEIQDVITKYGFGDILSYDILWLDFVAMRNWGYENGTPYHVDAGTFGGVEMINEYRGKTPLSDPEFREIYENSRKEKKMRGDLDKNTMFSFGPLSSPVSETQDQEVTGQPLFHLGPKGEIMGFSHAGKIYLNGENITPFTTMEEAGHVWLNWAKQNRQDLFDEGRKKVIGSPYLKGVESNADYHKLALQHGPKGSKEYNAYLQEEALAKAIGDQGAQFVSDNKRNDFKAWVLSMWKSIIDSFGIRDLTPSQIGELTLEQFAKMAAADMFSKSENKNNNQPEEFSPGLPDLTIPDNWDSPC